MRLVFIILISIGCFTGIMALQVRLAKKNSWSFIILPLILFLSIEAYCINRILLFKEKYSTNTVSELFLVNTFAIILLLILLLLGYKSRKES